MDTGKKDKKRACGTMGRGKRGEAFFCIFPLPIVPRAFQLIIRPLQGRKKLGDVYPGSVANLYGLCDWVVMALRMGPESRLCTFPLGRPVSRKAAKKNRVKQDLETIKTNFELIYRFSQG